MIECSILVDDLGNVSGYRIQGHSEMAPRGSDIVCAAVSALGQAVALGLEKVVDLDPRVTVRDGYLECLLPAEAQEAEGFEAGQALLQTLEMGLRQIEEEYPGRVHVENVSG